MWRCRSEGTLFPADQTLWCLWKTDDDQSRGDIYLPAYHQLWHCCLVTIFWPPSQSAEASKSKSVVLVLLTTPSGITPCSTTFQSPNTLYKEGGELTIVYLQNILEIPVYLSAKMLHCRGEAVLSSAFMAVQIWTLRWDASQITTGKEHGQETWRPSTTSTLTLWTGVGEFNIEVGFDRFHLGLHVRQEAVTRGGFNFWDLFKDS